MESMKNFGSLIFESAIVESNRDLVIKKVWQVSEALGLENPNHLMAVMWKESGINPKAINSNGGASGIIQFMPETAKWLGTTIEAVRKMDTIQQLELTEKYFKAVMKMVGVTKLKTYHDVYLAVFFPAALGKPDDWVLKTNKLSATTIANANTGIDLNKDKQITVGEFKQYATKKFSKEILDQL